MTTEHIYRDSIIFPIGILASFPIHEIGHFIMALLFGDTPQFAIAILYGQPTMVVQTYLIGMEYFWTAVAGPLFSAIILGILTKYCWGFVLGCIYQAFYIPVEILDIMVRHGTATITFLESYLIIFALMVLIVFSLMMYRKWVR